MKKTLLAVIVGVAALLSTSCNKNADHFNLLGRWESVEMSYVDNGKTITAPLTGLYYIFESGGKMTEGTAISATQSIEEQGTWKLVDGRLTVSVTSIGITTNTTYVVKVLDYSTLVLQGSLYEGLTMASEGTMTFKRVYSY